MFHDTITVFNRRGDVWYPTVLEGVRLMTDRAGIAARYGAQANDRAVALIPLREGTAGGKAYVPAKVWAELPDPAQAVTFAAGEAFDFLLDGPWPDGSPVCDGDYPKGFYDHMNRARDGVYAVTSVSKFDVIPHLEVTGR